MTEQELRPCPFCGDEANEMSVSEHANYLLNEYGRLQFDYAAYYNPCGESLRNEARNNLETYIAELEAENERYRRLIGLGLRGETIAMMGNGVG